MQDTSNRLLFLALTGAMCAAAMYGSEAGPVLFATAASVQPAHAEAPDAAPIVFTAPMPDRKQSEPSRQSPPTHDLGTATVVPNGTSCPGPAARALVSPPAAGPKPAAGQSMSKFTAPPSQPASPGTGSGCPPTQADAGAVVAPELPPAVSPRPWG